MASNGSLKVVVKLREREEDHARVQLGEAQLKVATAEAALREAEARTKREERRRGAAAEWLIADSAQVAALREAREAQGAVEATSAALVETRGRFALAHGRAEALRRLSQLRADEDARAADKSELKQADDAAILRHGRRLR